MSALDDARVVLTEEELDLLFSAAERGGTWHMGPESVLRLREHLRAVRAERESERAQLGELLVRAVEACTGGVSMETYNPGDYTIEGYNETGVYRASGVTLADALRALLAEVKGA